MKTFQLKTAMTLELGHMTYIDQSESLQQHDVTQQGKQYWPIGILHNTFSLLWGHTMTSYL